MRKWLLTLALMVLVVSTGCAALDALSNQLGAPAPGEEPTLAYKALVGAGKLAPNWAYNGILGLTTLLGWYRNGKNKKKVTITAQGVEKAIRTLSERHNEAKELAKEGKYEEAFNLMFDGEAFRDIISESAKAYGIYEELRSDVKKAVGTM